MNTVSYYGVNLTSCIIDKDNIFPHFQMLIHFHVRANTWLHFQPKSCEAACLLIKDCNEY